MEKMAEVFTADLAGPPTTPTIRIGSNAASATGIENVFAEVLAGVVRVDQVPVDSHFFDDLGADSMLMAQFCARVRKRPDLPSVSMKDVYQYPTVRSLAAALAPTDFAPAAFAPSSPLEGLLAEVLAGVVRVDQVPVDSHFFDDLGADSMLMAQFCARVRKRPDLPSVSMKDVYQYPTVRSLAAALAPTDFAPAAFAPSSPLEGLLAEVLAGVVRVDQVPVDSHFFDDLGADSMLMAQFCARVRKRPDLPSVSMKDVYEHPTISRLGAALAGAGVAPALAGSPKPAPAEPPDSASSGASSVGVSPTRTWEYCLCGALQLLLFLGYSAVISLVTIYGFRWISSASGVVDIYVRAVLLSTAEFLGICLLPILAKWTLVGRWKPQEIRIWSLAYVRFWFIKTLIRSNPLALLFVGTPLYPFYLRALGAKIGRNTAIFSRAVPICTDLLTIGAGSVIGKESSLLCYRAHAGRIQIGAVTLGENVFVGEKTALDIDSSMGDDAQLGHTSALYPGQAVPQGERWHGVPAVRATVEYARVAPASCSRLRKIRYSSLLLLRWLLVYVPIALGAVYVLLLNDVPALHALLGPDGPPATSPTVYLYALILSLSLFCVTLLLGLLMVGTVPRLLNRFITPGKVYPLYGFHYGIHRLIERLTNRKFFTFKFGDSSFIVHYLRWLGYDLGRVEQTGANFGMELTHDSPHLTSIGTGTMVADSLYILNTEHSSTSFRLSQVSIGAHNFLGNLIAFPPRARIGDNCLLATKVMVPLDGKIRENVGLLGSPSFEIPRSVSRDHQFDHLATGDEQCRRLARKNRYDVRTIGLYLFVRWVELFLLTTIGLFGVDVLNAVPDVLLTPSFVVAFVVITTYLILVERSFTAFRRLRPQYCSIYEPYFWWHERYWKVPLTDMYLKAFDGTPFKPVVMRLLGLRVGRRLFDDGCLITEKTLTAIGDDCTLNHGSKLQAHSQEDGAFKCDYVTLGAGVTIGVEALVHYGTTLGDGSTVAADSFLMKGEEVPPLAHWGGNPAREI